MNTSSSTQTLSLWTRVSGLSQKKALDDQKVQILLREGNIAFRSGDGALYSAPRANLKKSIWEAKAAYRTRIKNSRAKIPGRYGR